MLREGFKKYVALLLAILVIFSSVAIVSAATINSSGGSASSMVTVDIAPFSGGSGTGGGRRFSVSVPTVLPIEVLEDNTRVYATNAAIINNSTAAVEVDEVRVRALNGWSLLDYDTNFDDLSENTKAFAMHILGDEANANTGLINCTNWGSIGRSKSLNLDYDIKVPYFTYGVEESISEVVFTISFAN